jgi:hypothetical protein
MPPWHERQAGNTRGRSPDATPAALRRVMGHECLVDRGRAADTARTALARTPVRAERKRGAMASAWDGACALQPLAR